MTERPIIFTTDSIEAILAGRKTQTRRVAKSKNGQYVFHQNGQMQWGNGRWYYSPYGRPGDSLWVRETWAVNSLWDHLKPAEIEPNITGVYYAEDGGQPFAGYKKRSPIFMPRWASRITLRVTGVRVERVQDISEADAMAELGAPPWIGDGPEPYRRNLRQLFIDLWDSINAKRGYSWASNPWVWVVEFEVKQ